MFVGRDHEMPAVVWKFVEDTEALVSSMHYKVFFVLIILNCVAEKASVFFWMFLNIRDAPGRPKVLHCLITLTKI